MEVKSAYSTLKPLQVTLNAFIIDRPEENALKSKVLETNNMWGAGKDRTKMQKVQ